MDYLPRISLTSSPAYDAALIMLFSVLAAGVTDIFLTRVLRRVVTFTTSDFDNRIVSLLHRPVFITVILLGAALAIQPLDLPASLTLLLQTLLIVIWVMTLLRVSGVIFEYLPKLLPSDSTAGQHVTPLAKNLSVFVLLLLGVMGVLMVWDISITPLLASAGLAGAAVAFAAKDTIANFLGGISILADRPYTIGHFIILESGERGEVVDIGLRSTRIKTRDDVLITVPNSVMANSKIINESAPIKRFRVRIPVGVAYGSDPEKIEAVLLAVAGENSRVEESPEPRVRMRAFGDSSLNFELLCWTNDPMDKGKVTHELNKAVYRRFNEEHITIPFPQRDVHLHRSEDA